MLDHMSSTGVMHGDGRRRGEETVKHEVKKNDIAAVHAWYRNTRMRQRAAEKKGQTFHQQGKSQDPSGVVPMDLDTMCQGQGKQQHSQNQQSLGSGKNWAS